MTDRERAGCAPAFSLERDVARIGNADPVRGGVHPAKGNAADLEKLPEEPRTIGMELVPVGIAENRVRVSEEVLPADPVRTTALG